MIRILGSALRACPACACGTPSCITISGPPHALVPGRPAACRQRTVHRSQLVRTLHARRPFKTVRHNVRHQDTGTYCTPNTELQRIWYSRNLVVSRKFIQLMHRSPSLHASCTHPSEPPPRVFAPCSGMNVCHAHDDRRVAQMRVRAHIAWLAIRALVKLAHPRQFGRYAWLALIW